MLNCSTNAISSFAGDILPLQVEAQDLPICCTSSDPSIARIKELTYGKYLVVLEAEGDAVITIRTDTQTASCPVHVRKADVSDPDGTLQIFVGDTHSHTGYSDGKLTPFDAYKRVAEEHYLDYFTISDHCVMVDEDEFFHTFEAAQIHQGQDFIAFAGCESQVSPLSVNSIGNAQNNGGEIVTIHTEGRCFTDDWNTFFDSVGTNQLGFGIMAHPQILGYSIHSIWNSFDPEHTAHQKVYDFIRGIETINSVDDSNLIHERAFSLALDCGYKVAPAAGSDHHSILWGKEAIRSRTFLYAREKSKELFLDAYRNARFYSCENGNVKLFYTVNGKNPATTLDLTDTYCFRIHASLFDPSKLEDTPILAEVVSDYGQVIASKELAADQHDFTITVTSDAARYFYLKLYSANGDRTWSTPIWTGRAFDPCPKPQFEKAALNNEQFHVIFYSSGSNADSILNTDLSDYYISDAPTAELVIDMGAVHTISAAGYYPNSIVRKQPETIACFLSRYEYWTSLDGISYEPACQGMVRLYGSEHIAQFAPREARYLKLKALSSVGSDGSHVQFKNVPVAIGALRIY